MRFAKSLAASLSELSPVGDSSPIHCLSRFLVQFFKVPHSGTSTLVVANADMCYILGNEQMFV